MRTVEGGHAIMLGLELPDELKKISEDWIAESPSTRAIPSLGWHMTVVFFGRNLPDFVGMKMFASAMLHKERIPGILHTAGTLRMFGAKRDHLVSMISVPRGFHDLRRHINNDTFQPKPLETNYNPHVTLAIGEQNAPIPEVGNKLLRFPIRVASVQVKTGSEVRSIRL